MKKYLKISKPTFLNNTNLHFYRDCFKHRSSKKLLSIALVCFFYFNAFTQDDAPIWTTVLDSPQGTFQEIQEDFNKYWEGKEYIKGKGYKQYKRWEIFMAPRIYPSYDMTLPSSNYHNFMEWKRSQPESAQARTIASNWTSLGPFAKPTGADTGVGRLNMVRFEPGNPSTMYVGAPDGGLWKSTNGGTSWATTTDFLGVIGVSDLAIDPGNTQIMYLATGDLEGDRRSIGVLKSTDGGSTWNTTGLTWTAIDNYKISKLLMDPTNSSVLLAATDGGVFRTTDGGANWTSPSTIENFQDMEFKPGLGTNPNTVYAAGKEFWKSIDNGVSWTKITSGVPSLATVSRIAIGVSADNSDYVYLLVGKSSDNGFLGMYRSTDSGTTFSTRSTSPNVLGFVTDGSDSGGQAFYDLAITVSPGDADFVTVGGINMWQSQDGGATWYILSHWNPDPNYQFVHADIHEINYLPGNNLTFFACGDGGISKTTDEGVTWTDISNNLVISQQTTVGISASTASHLVAGLQDIGTIYTTGSWSVIGGGDGEDCFIDRTNNNNIVITGTNGSHQLSTNGGTSFSDIITGLPSGSSNAEFYSPIRQDPTVATRIYAGGRINLYRSNNMGTTWVSTGATPFGSTTSDRIIEFNVAPSDNTVIYALKGTAIAKSSDSGATWTNITGTLPTGSASLTKVAISDTDSDKAWVTFSGYSSANKVFKTTDGGGTWINISTGLPNLPANTIVYRNGSGATVDEVYIGMDIGVYRYDNSLSSWEAYSTSLPNVRVRDLKIYYPTSKLRAATYGRGTWESPLATALPVELISFSGKNVGRKNDLFWSTTAEIDLEKYNIERSIDGENFELVGTVLPEAANSNEMKNYTFTDTRPAKGINYYRLNIIDIDDKFEYSQIIVLFVDDLKNEISLFPNPTTNFIEVKGVTPEETTIYIMDALGRSIRSEQLSRDEPINVSYLPNGTYFIELRTKGEKPIVKRFIKQ
ncbi:MAG: T9SS type A sorting domain-containing protein [Saprospiraceae bacterium]